MDVADLAEVEAAFTPRTKVLYCESLSKPTLRVADIPRLAEIAHRHGALLVVDNTFTPLIVAPIQHGADVVVHSLTKFMNGASDHIAGAVCGTTEFIMRPMDLHSGSLMLLGPTMDPQVAFDISLRLPHLGLRMAEHSRRAQAMASRLAALGLPVTYGVCAMTQEAPAAISHSNPARASVPRARIFNSERNQRSMIDSLVKKRIAVYMDRQHPGKFPFYAKAGLCN